MGALRTLGALWTLRPLLALLALRPRRPLGTGNYSSNYRRLGYRYNDCACITFRNRNSITYRTNTYRGHAV